MAAPGRTELGPGGPAQAGLGSVAEAAAAVPSAAGRLGLSPAEAGLLAPDHPFLRAGRWRGFIGDGDRAASRLVASIDPRQRDPRGPVGCIGFVHLDTAPDVEAGCDDDAGRDVEARQDHEAARRVIAEGVGWLRREGVAVIRCPVNLSTWYGHRAMTAGFPDEPGAVPAFPLEPAPERRLPPLVEASGFAPVHRAVSCLVDSASVAATTTRAIDRARRAGFRDRPIRLADLDHELRLLHRLSERIFADAWGFSPIAFAEFESIYRPLRDVVAPELIRILEDHGGAPVGFVLGLPGAGGSFVVKTIGVTDEARRQAPGIGGALTGIVHRVALEQGRTQGVHALMAEGSVAHRLSLRWGREFRRYATFERAFAGAA